MVEPVTLESTESESTQGDSANNVVTLALPGQDSVIPQPPRNLRGEVYSPTALEVFWEHSGTANLRYRVALNGEIITTTDGKSYFFDGLQSGGRYVVDVMTIAPDNQISIGSTVVLYTP